MLLQDEQHVVKWLSQYGALTKTQVMKLLQRPKSAAEKIINNLYKELMVSSVGGGYYLGLDRMARPDQRTIIAV